MQRSGKPNPGIFIDGRVSVDPVPLEAGQPAYIRYNGLLAKSGADKVYMHLGYGQYDWQQLHDVELNNDGTSWWTRQVINGPEKLRFCFYDSAHNWDNNNGMDWCCDVVNSSQEYGSY